MSYTECDCPFCGTGGDCAVCNHSAPAPKDLKRQVHNKGLMSEAEFAALLDRLVQEAKAQAYEEAAKVAAAFEHLGGSPAVAAAIRALQAGKETGR